MKNIVLSAVAVLAMSSFAVAGGDITPGEEPIVVVEPVVDDSGLYLGLGYGFLKNDSNFFDVSWHNRNIDFNDDYSAIMLQAGYKVNSYVAIEGRYWIGLSDETFNNPLNHNILDDFDTDATAWGIYVKPMYPVTDALNIYALLGYASVTVNNVEINNIKRDFDVDGFSWGIGTAYSFTDNFSIFIDYVDFEDDDIKFDHNGATGTFNHAFDSINLGVTYTF